jgi:hypothetical protein
MSFSPESSGKDSRGSIEEKHLTAKFTKNGRSRTRRGAFYDSYAEVTPVVVPWPIDQKHLTAKIAKKGRSGREDELFWDRMLNLKTNS